LRTSDRRREELPEMVGRKQLTLIVGACRKLRDGVERESFFFSHGLLDSNAPTSFLAFLESRFFAFFE
jgi:hypothetical protein